MFVTSCNVCLKSGSGGPVGKLRGVGYSEIRAGTGLMGAGCGYMVDQVRTFSNLYNKIKISRQNFSPKNYPHPKRFVSE